MGSEAVEIEEFHVECVHREVGFLRYIVIGTQLPCWNLESVTETY